MLQWLVFQTKIKKERWTQDQHKIFMQEYEKYGNDCMHIAQVLSTQTPSQIKKHAECFFNKILIQILQRSNDIESHFS
jgi:hypothetical protein